MQGYFVRHLHCEVLQFFLDFRLVLLNLLIDPHRVNLHKLVHLVILDFHISQLDLGFFELMDKPAAHEPHFLDLPEINVLLLLNGLLLQLGLLQLFLLNCQVDVDLILKLRVHILQVLLVLTLLFLQLVL